ncbi:hypothetical protein CIRG_03639 [Coccidioides immitis RMSCC 2394]|uniref:Uncharacterized protein n=1 Tax=Coccidioides immitis RMSCC 2394 TaxID=404692 RepID=A0A0J7B2A2_COCIT|nr:hypothetical protein CIRG_03639 [Coccidioides immitis RMSCC 2394]
MTFRLQAVVSANHCVMTERHLVLSPLLFFPPSKSSTCGFIGFAHVEHVSAFYG